MSTCSTKGSFHDGPPTPKYLYPDPTLHPRPAPVCSGSLSLSPWANTGGTSRLRSMKGWGMSMQLGSQVTQLCSDHPYKFPWAPPPFSFSQPFLLFSLAFNLSIYSLVIVCFLHSIVIFTEQGLFLFCLWLYPQCLGQVFLNIYANNKWLLALPLISYVTLGKLPTSRFTFMPSSCARHNLSVNSVYINSFKSHINLMKWLPLLSSIIDK